MFVPTDNACGLPLPSPIKILPLVDKSTAVRADVPLPMITPLAVKLVAPVPPLPTTRVADSPADVPLVFCEPAAFTPGKSIFAEPLNETPPMFLAVVRVAAEVAVAEFPVHEPEEPEVLPVTLPVNAPANPVAVKMPLLELNAKLEPDLGAKSPVAAVVNNGKQVVSLLSSATVTFVDVVAVALFPVQLPALPLAFPVTFPVNAPAKPVAVKIPELELKARLLPDLGGRSPVAAVTNNGKHVVSEDSSATVIFVDVVAVAELPLQEAELPDVFWFPAEFTPGKSMLAVPLKDTPPIFLAVSNAVAVAAFPVVEPDVPEVLPVTLPVKFPENVPDNTSVLELKVNPDAVFGPRSPVAAVVNKGKQVVSEDSSATVIAVGT